MRSKPIADPAQFYDSLANDYRKVEKNWEEWLDFNQLFLGNLLKAYFPKANVVLDCAAGIGSQTIALQRLGLKVVASDASMKSLQELEKHADVRTHHVTWNNLKSCFANEFDAVFCLENAIGHTNDEDTLEEALSCMMECLKPSISSCLFVSTRDFDLIHPNQPLGFPENSSKDDHYFQKWDWISDTTYLATWFIEGEVKLTAPMRCIYRKELYTIADKFNLQIEECSSLYTQPIYLFRRRPL